MSIRLEVIEVGSINHWSLQGGSVRKRDVASHCELLDEVAHGRHKALGRVEVSIEAGLLIKEGEEAVGDQLGSLSL